MGPRFCPRRECVPLRGAAGFGGLLCHALCRGQVSSGAFRVPGEWRADVLEEGGRVVAPARPGRAGVQPGPGRAGAPAPPEGADVPAERRRANNRGGRWHVEVGSPLHPHLCRRPSTDHSPGGAWPDPVGGRRCRGRGYGHRHGGGRRDRGHRPRPEACGDVPARDSRAAGAPWRNRPCRPVRSAGGSADRSPVGRRAEQAAAAPGRDRPADADSSQGAPR
jgi:hypothetical protein